MKKIIWLVCLLALSCSAIAKPPRTFSEAKKVARQIHLPESGEFYCGCLYRGNEVDKESCGYIPRKNAGRGGRIEWEHVVPAWVIGHQRHCWQQGGRPNCARNDPLFQRAEADLHNLFPAIGEINGDRSQFSFAWLSQPPHQYGQCQTVIDFKARKVMPRKEVRGTVARVYFYMSERYGLQLSAQDKKLFDAWHRAYPPSEEEKRLNQRVACVMGHGNHFVGEVDLRRCS